MSNDLISSRLSSFLLSSFLLCVGASGADLRPASLDEIQTLFDLATTGPQRLRVVAVISSNEPKWSDEQVAAEIRHQNELYEDLAELAQAQQRARTNAIARSHSGRRILHVQEWYSGSLYRLDQTEEGMVSEQYLKDRPGAYRNSYVNIDDPALSPYRSYFADHQLRSAQLSKTTLYGKNDLWRPLGLEGELAFPILVVLLDSKSLPPGRPFTDAELGTLKMDPSKAEQLHNDFHPTRHLDVIAENAQEHRTRFMLRGRFLSPDGAPARGTPDGMSDMEFVYDVGRVGQMPVCLEASFTNHTAHTSFISKREGFDAQGFPHVWKRTTIKPGSPPKQLDVVFEEVELNPTFSDEQVFSTVFPANYIVSDVTSGKAVVLQNPIHPATTTQPLARPSPVKRVIILCVFGLVALVLGIALLRMKRKE